MYAEFSNGLVLVQALRQAYIFMHYGLFKTKLKKKHWHSAQHTRTHLLSDKLVTQAQNRTEVNIRVILVRLLPILIAITHH